MEADWQRSGHAPKSYYESLQKNVTTKNYNPQRLWWAMSADNYQLVDRARTRCEDGRIGKAYVRCYKPEEEDNITYKQYVTILKRFDKPVSTVGVQKWLDFHFNNTENWCMKIWKPLHVEIVYKRLFDDNDLELHRLVWAYCPNFGIWPKNLISK
ncbi:Hypothetical predicted protein [Paramuricea clavata]|uniref:Uncharacterized protein n=1 Tax=Paramuricea clavata TaxID=317549 RepID=A0A7D9ESQ2_PARCT|nr:Hypothetical predicted protein [Paramuricea clavata]